MGALPGATKYVRCSVLTATIPQSSCELYRKGDPKRKIKPRDFCTGCGGPKAVVDMGLQLKECPSCPHTGNGWKPPVHYGTVESMIAAEKTSCK